MSDWMSNWANSAFVQNVGKGIQQVFNPGLTNRVNYDAGGAWNGAEILNQMLEGYMNSARTQALEDRAYTAAREDSAIQRRVDDLKKAGFNPWLAIQSGVGEAASSASTVGSETNAAMQMANSAASVLASYASLPSKNFKNLASAIKSIINSIGLGR